MRFRNDQPAQVGFLDRSCPSGTVWRDRRSTQELPLVLAGGRRDLWPGSHRSVVYRGSHRASHPRWLMSRQEPHIPGLLSHPSRPLPEEVLAQAVGLTGQVRPADGLYDQESPGEGDAVIASSGCYRGCGPGTAPPQRARPHAMVSPAPEACYVPASRASGHTEKPRLRVQK